MKGESDMKQYTAPDMEIIAFEAEDVITGSIITDTELPAMGEE